MANTVLLSGRLARDLEVISFQNGGSLYRSSIAVNRYYKDRDGEGKQEVSFIPIQLYENLGKAVSGFVGKGSLVVIEGELREERFTDKDGNNRSIIKVIVNNLEAGSGGEKSDRSNNKASFTKSSDNKKSTKVKKEEPKEYVEEDNYDISVESDDVIPF